MYLKEKIRAERERLGMTQQELADKIYVTRQTVSRWESGNRCPDLIMAKKLADLFEVSLDDLVAGGDVEGYVAPKAAVTSQKKTLAAIFMLVLSVWFEVYALLAGSAVFGVITIVLVFASCFLFVAGYFQDSES